MSAPRRERSAPASTAWAAREAATHMTVKATATTSEASRAGNDWFSAIVPPAANRNVKVAVGETSAPASRPVTCCQPVSGNCSSRRGSTTPSASVGSTIGPTTHGMRIDANSASISRSPTPPPDTSVAVNMQASNPPTLPTTQVVAK